MGVYAILVLPLFLRPSSLLVRAGQVAPQDFQAPRSTEYISTIRTDHPTSGHTANINIYTSPTPRQTSISRNYAIIF